MRTLIAISALVASVSTIAQTQVPNVFEDGTPASAAEVNENFDALESAIDANSGVTESDAVFLYSDDRVVGPLHPHSSSMEPLILTSAGFLMRMTYLTNAPGDPTTTSDFYTGSVVYLTDNCEGQSYGAVWNYPNYRVRGEIFFSSRGVAYVLSLIHI